MSLERSGLDRSAERRAWAASVALAALLLAVDGAMVWAFRVRPWTLAVPGLVVAIALRGRSASLASWRDLLGILCLVTIPFVGLLPPDAPRPMRFALNSLGTAGVVLLAIGAILDDGIGAGVRRRDWGAAREGVRQVGARLYTLFSLWAYFLGAAWMRKWLGLPVGFLLLPLAALILSLFPPRWGRWIGYVAAVGLVLVAVGAAAGRWPWGAILFSVAACAFGTAEEPKRLFRPVPPRDAGGRRGETELAPEPVS